MSAKKEMREIINLISALGGEILGDRRAKHTCLRVRFGVRCATIPVACSNSDVRGHKNKLALIRRIARDAGVMI